MKRTAVVLAAAILGGAAARAEETKSSAVNLTPFGRRNNPCGVHLLTTDPGAVDKQLDWSHALCGDGGYAKTLCMGVVNDTRGPHGNWVHFVKACYARRLIPILRLAGENHGGTWVKPREDSPGVYRSMGEAVKSVVAGLPFEKDYPVYIEIWNEPGMTVEWSGRPDAAEYAHFLVDVAKAIRSLNEPRARILNAGLAPWDEMLKRVPESANAFDVLAVHPYPQNLPPELNWSEVKDRKLVDEPIDRYREDIELLAKYGRKNVQVMITETGYDLGDKKFDKYPIIDEENRADYMFRAFRDYYMKWPEVVGVTPFLFTAGGGWSNFDWVFPGSATDANGWPKTRHLQYDWVAWLAKPNDPTGAISGKAIEKTQKTPVAGVTVTLAPADGKDAADPAAAKTFTTSTYGNYVFPKLEPGAYKISCAMKGYRTFEAGALKVTAGDNTVANVALEVVSGASIKGKVMAGTPPKPLAGAEITAIGGKAKATSSADGSFRLTGLAPGRVDLAATKKGYNTHLKKQVEATVDETNETVFLINADAHASGNLARNGAYEDAVVNGMPMGWLAQDGNAHPDVIGADRETRRSGDASVRIKANHRMNYIWHMTEYNSIRQGTSYVFEAWVKTDGLEKGNGKGAVVTILYFNNEGGATGGQAGTATVEGTQEWKQLTIKSTAPPKSERVQISIHADGDKGTAWFDDVYFGPAK